MIAVIGANGFVGQEIITQAVKQGITVRAAGRSPNRLRTSVPFVECDMVTGHGLEAACQGAQVVICAAGMAHRPPHEIDADLYHQVNGVGCRRVVEAAAACGVSHVILLSSLSVYGSPGGLTDELTPCHPEGPYAISKKEGEDFALDAGARHGIPITCLRLATVYGAYDPGNFVRLIRMVERGRFIFFGNGRNRKTVIHRSDAARACLAVANTPNPGTGVYNLTENIYSTREIVQAVENAVHVQSKLPAIPTGVTNGLIRLLEYGGIRGKQAANSIDRWLSDEAHLGTRFQQAFSYQCSMSLQQGIDEEVVWYQQHHSTAVSS